MPKSDIVQYWWDKSTSFKQFWWSYFYLMTHPKECMRHINFSMKIITYFEVDIDNDTPSTKKADGGDITASNTRIGGTADASPKSDKSDFANSQDVSGNNATNGGCR